MARTFYPWDEWLVPGTKLPATLVRHKHFKPEVKMMAQIVRNQCYKRRLFVTIVFLNDCTIQLYVRKKRSVSGRPSAKG